MTAILTMFDGVALPEYDFVNPGAGTGPTTPTTSKTAGGGFFDAQGSERGALDLPYDLPFRGVLAEDSYVALEARLKALKGLRGKVGRLYRALADGSTQWCEAKCLRVGTESEAGRGPMLELSFDFEVRSPWYGAWHGSATYLGQPDIYLGDGHVLGHTESYELDTSPKTITLTNGGEGQVKNVRVTVFAGDGTMTALRLAAGSNCEWDFTETVNVNKSLILDSGAWTVTNGGADAWNGLQVTANHKRGEWLLLEPGDNTVTVTFTSNASATKPRIRFDFWDVHE